MQTLNVYATLIDRKCAFDHLGHVPRMMPDWFDSESRIYSHCTVKDAFRDAYCRSICMFLDDVNKCRRLCRTDFMLTMWNCQMNWIGLSFPSSNYGIKLLLVRLMTARVLGLLCYVIHCYLGCHMDLVLIDLVFFYNFYDKFIQWLKCSSTFPHIAYSP